MRVFGEPLQTRKSAGGGKCTTFNECLQRVFTMLILALEQIRIFSGKMIQHDTAGTDPFTLPARNARIVVVQLGKLGDTILTTPLLAALKSHLVGSHITVITPESNLPLLVGHPAVDRVVPSYRGIVQFPSLARRLRNEGYDLSIDFKDHRSRSSRILAGIIRADQRIIHPLNAPDRANNYVLPHWDPPGHYVDRALAPMKLIAPGKRFARRPRLLIPIEAVRAVDAQLVPNERGIVVINISAGDRSRHWGLGKWEDTIDIVSKTYSVVVISSPEDRSKADDICAMRRLARPVRTSTIMEAAAVIDRAVAVITPDTSIVHLASAIDVPCVALFPSSPANLASFAPLSSRNVVLLPDGDELLANIEVPRVVEALERIISN